MGKFQGSEFERINLENSFNNDLILRADARYDQDEECKMRIQVKKTFDTFQKKQAKHKISIKSNSKKQMEGEEIIRRAHKKAEIDCANMKKLAIKWTEGE